MSVVKSLGIDQLLTSHGIRFFLEIGAGTGADVEYASTLGLEHAYSIEPVHMFAWEVYKRNISNKKLTVAFGRVTDCVKGILELIPADAPVLYWLDAQASDVRFGLTQDEIADFTPERKALFVKANQMAEDYLKFIVGQRDIAHDVFLLGGYGGARVEDFAPAVELLGPTHDLELVQGDQPAIRALPKRQ